MTGFVQGCLTQNLHSTPVVTESCRLGVACPVAVNSAEERSNTQQCNTSRYARTSFLSWLQWYLQNHAQHGLHGWLFSKVAFGSLLWLTACLSKLRAVKRCPQPRWHPHPADIFMRATQHRERPRNSSKKHTHTYTYIHIYNIMFEVILLHPSSISCDTKLESIIVSKLPTKDNSNPTWVTQAWHTLLHEKGISCKS